MGAKGWHRDLGIGMRIVWHGAGFVRSEDIAQKKLCGVNSRAFGLWQVRDDPVAAHNAHPGVRLNA
jgi:hypothetical protein